IQYSYVSSSPMRRALPPVLARKLMPLMSATGRLRLRLNPGSPDLKPLTWDEGEAWRLWLEVRQDDRDQWTIARGLPRGNHRLARARQRTHGFDRAAADSRGRVSDRARLRRTVRRRRYLSLGHAAQNAEEHSVPRSRAGPRACRPAESSNAASHGIGRRAALR